ncbi:menaquinone biosynthetic enzyme MqnA/MqnD family protein [Staphylospora marina]|uniref:menaquinone biosynthetic enzyme MqnA/MqnD family protein n=1 Tax=Staphylospora marina TaxID=2490858 RepID=UPI000F5BFE90|nr:menaquinone biosynthesis protein [Staphylospora marina]
MTVRVGKISFTNVLPIYQHLDATGLDIELVPEVPARLNKAMAEGGIDLSPISSFAFGARHRDFYLLPDLSVSAWGDVRSVCLFTKGKSLSELDGARVALTPKSASSVALLRILLERYEGVKPRYETMEPDLPRMLESADAALLIGDDAIVGGRAHPEYRVFDLGREWHERTGHSMTFAVWAVRREVAHRSPNELANIHERFLEAKESGKRDLRPAVHEAMRLLGGDEGCWERYFRGLTYDLGERELEGLKLFFRHCAELSLLPEDVEICMPDLGAGTGMR